MYPGSSAVKQTAKDTLKGKYLKTVALVSIFIFSVFVIRVPVSLISFLKLPFLTAATEIVLSVFITVPLLLGLIKTFWNLIFGCECNADTLFYYFSSSEKYKKAARFSAMFALRIAFVAFILYLPSIIIAIISDDSLISRFDLVLPLWVLNLKNLLGIIVAITTVILPFVLVKYFASAIIFVADEKIEPDEAFHLSQMLTRRSGADFISFNLSFIGWIILMFTVFALPFVLPYYLASYCVFVRFSVTEYNIAIKREASRQNYYGGYYG